LKNPDSVANFRARKRADKAPRKTAAPADPAPGAGLAPHRGAEHKSENSLQQFRALSAHVQSVREEERKRISREVHDELGQSLTAIKIELTWVMQRLSGVEEPIRRRIESALQMVVETMDSVRRIAAELRPGILDDLGLSAAIEWLAQEFQERTGITCEARLPALGDAGLDPEFVTATFRVFEEILSNIARHAHATRVEVRLMRSVDTVTLEVRDNGKGITDEQISNPKSLGLLGMRERTRLLGGRFAIHGQDGKGTTVIVQIPVQKPLQDRGG